uniref:Uncharacterized protein n=1 Tax=Salix viminalis TaxID=40686 RepID=A0A6N2NJD9_SALVM
MLTGQFRSRATKGLRVHVKAGFADLPTSPSLSYTPSLSLYIYIQSPQLNQTPTLLSLSLYRRSFLFILLVFHLRCCSSFKLHSYSELILKENIYCDTLEAF